MSEPPAWSDSAEQRSVSFALRGFLKRPGLWWTLIALNIVLLTAQPAVLFLSVLLVLGLHAVVMALDAIPDDWGPRTVKFVFRLVLWCVVYCLAVVGVAFVWLSTGQRIGTTDDIYLLGGGAALTLGLYLFWRWWRRPRTVIATELPVALDVARDAVRDEADRLEDERRAMEQTAQQKRREDARAKVELFFNAHAPELAGRFTRAMLDEYVQRYMGDGRPADVVDERGESLIAVIRQHLDRAVPKATVQTLDDILAAFASRKRKIQESGLEREDVEHLLIQLEDQREAAVTKAIQEGRV